jgi:hypothetical protein
MAYPFVTCDIHGEQRSYLVCAHVTGGTAPVHILPATDQEMGEILCGGEHSDAALDDLKVCCAAHCALVTVS